MRVEEHTDVVLFWSFTIKPALNSTKEELLKHTIRCASALRKMFLTKTQRMSAKPISTVELHVLVEAEPYTHGDITPNSYRVRQRITHAKVTAHQNGSHVYLWLCSH